MKACVIKITKQGVRLAAYLMLADDDENEDIILERAIERVARENGAEVDWTWHRPFERHWWMEDVGAEMNHTSSADDLVRLVISKITGRTVGGVDYLGNEIWLDETLGILGMEDDEVTRFCAEAEAAVASAGATPWFEEAEEPFPKVRRKPDLRRGLHRGRQGQKTLRRRAAALARAAAAQTGSAQSSAE